MIKHQHSQLSTVHCTCVVHISVYVLTDLFLSVGGDSIPHMHTLSVGVQEQCTVWVYITIIASIQQAN